MADARTQRRAVLITVTVLVWVAAIGNSTYKFRLAAKAAVLVSLTTKPETILVSVDGERQFEGGYVLTPVKLGVPPGKHKIKIARDGYIAHVVTVEGDSGEQFHMDDVVLQKNPDLLFAKVTVEGPETPVYVEIDDGLVRGDTPLVTTDVTLAADHHLTVYPRGKADLDVKWKCRFSPQGETEGAEHAIKVRTKGDQVKAAGCEKVGAKAKKP